MTFTEPMIATFDLSVGNSLKSIPSERTILFYGVPAVTLLESIRRKRKDICTILTCLGSMTSVYSNRIGHLLYIQCEETFLRA